MTGTLTITFNPCIDKSTSEEILKSEKEIRCAAPVFEPGGGGIIVAMAIKKLGGNAIAVYPSGGYSGKSLNVLLERENIPGRTVIKTSSSFNYMKNAFIRKSQFKI